MLTYRIVPAARGVITPRLVDGLFGGAPVAVRGSAGPPAPFSPGATPEQAIVAAVAGGAPWPS